MIDISIDPDLETDPDLERRRASLAASLPLDFPFTLLIESTNVCNLDCFFCPRKEAEKGIGLMDFDLFVRIVDECAERGPLKLINLHKDGEPLAHPRIFDMVRHISETGAAERFGFTSNGILLTEKRSDKLLDAGLNQISFSIDAVTEDSYERSKGRRKYQVVEDNVRCFLETKPEYVKTAVKFIRMQENLGEEERFREIWSQYDVDVVVTEYHDWSGSVRDSSLLSVLPTEQHACENPFYQMAVNWDGTVSLCCVDWDVKGQVGDARSSSLYDIWHGETFARFRELHLSGRACEVEACQGCTYKSDDNRRVIGGWLMANRDHVLASANCKVASGVR